MKAPIVSLTTLVLFCLCGAKEEERPEGISQQLFSDSYRMVEDSIFGNSIAGRYIIKNPERFREPLRKFAASTDDPGSLISAAHLAFGILSDEDFFAIAEKALKSIPEIGPYPVEEARSTMVSLIEKRKVDINQRESGRIAPETNSTQQKRGSVRGSPREEEVNNSPAISKGRFFVGAIGILGLLFLLFRIIFRGSAS